MLRRGSEKFLVQCKQWKALKVGVEIVRELYGVIAASGATGGVVVTSGTFTNEAIAFAQGRNVTLVDGPQLHRLLQQAKRAAGATAAKATTAAPACPACGKGMVRRVSRRGSEAGSKFWGCSGFPACQGTRPLD